MERLTRKLKKGGYSANRHPAAQIDERLSQLKGVHKQWVGDVSDMITGMKQSEAAGQAGALTLAMLQASYAAIVRIGRRFEAPPRATPTTPSRRSASSRICTSSASPSSRTPRLVWMKKERSRKKQSLSERNKQRGRFPSGPR